LGENHEKGRGFGLHQLLNRYKRPGIRENDLDLAPGPMSGGNQRGYSAQQDQTLDVSRCLVQAVEDLAAGIVGGHRVHVAANGIASRIHARDDGKLRIAGKHHHRQHQNGRRNNGAEVRPRNDNHDQKDQSAKQAYPVQAHQRAADDQTSSMNARARRSEKRWKLAKRDGGKNGTKEHQPAQPKAERQVDQRVKERSHIPC
jgi:hypothetical protein